ncbi:type II secretion system protein [Allohahella marinimesophila]|uniref:MSHA pilin protein MshA n=1 Tax=Allohahella marinimesophila TaxID=1054972 RepID=A0ABP7PVA4_9GAMM
MKQAKSGFTLVELAMLIVIVGILSAIVFPRFAGLNGEARSILLSGVESALKSAAAMSYAAYLKEGKQAEHVMLQKAQVRLEFGYPAASDAGILAAAKLPAADFNISSETVLLTEQSDADAAPAEAGPVSVQVVTIRALNAVDPSACHVTYQAAMEPNSRPLISRSTNGC